MFFSGISDEAGQDIASQVRAHQELGWKYMELRVVDGVNIATVPDRDFEAVYGAVTEADLGVSCFSSAIANWARPITSDFELDKADLLRAIPRMHRFGTPFIRVMSYPNDSEHPVDEAYWRRESIKRMKYLAHMAEDGGVVLVHENCSGWGGLSAENSTILLGEVGSPALKVVYDTGNPVTYGQNGWEYYQRVLPDIVYVHIKDARKIDGKDHYCMCGDGDGYVKDIVGDLLHRGYEGGFSIEPHLEAIIHTGQKADNAEALYQSYTAYGRRLMEIVAEVAST